MSGQDIGSMIGLYAFMVIFLFLAHLFSACMSGGGKYNENRKTIKVGLKWLFWRFTKEDNLRKNEMFLIAFVHELISVILLIIATAMFIFSILLNEQLIMIIGAWPAFVYSIYCVIVQRRTKKQVVAKS